MRLYFSSLLVCLSFCCLAQCKFKTLSISVFNNGTSMPFSGKAGIINTPIHPGIDVGTSIDYNSNIKNRFYQTFKIGYFYHHQVQQGIQLYSEAGYRRNMGCFGAGALLGGGYFHSIPDVKIFECDNGYYKSKRLPMRPQAMVSFAPMIDFDLQKKNILPGRIFVEYQIWFQLPFVKSYVPVLPNNSLHIGFIFNLHNASEQ